MNIALDEQVLAEVLGVVTHRTKSLMDEWWSKNFTRHIAKLDYLNIKIVSKKFLK